jgi:hypothetical protein
MGNSSSQTLKVGTVINENWLVLVFIVKGENGEV